RRRPPIQCFGGRRVSVHPDRSTLASRPYHRKACSRLQRNLERSCQPLRRALLREARSRPDRGRCKRRAGQKKSPGGLAAPGDFDSISVTVDAVEGADDFPGSLRQRLLYMATPTCVGYHFVSRQSRENAVVAFSWYVCHVTTSP